MKSWKPKNKPEYGRIVIEPGNMRRLEFTLATGTVGKRERARARRRARK